MEEIQIRECTTIEEFDSCIYLQREAFGLPDLEISPRRHLIVSRQAGGWTLGAFCASYCRVVAGRYRGVIDAYDVWNEPWITEWWAVGYDETKGDRLGYVRSPTPAADYVRLMAHLDAEMPRRVHSSSARCPTIH